MEKGEDSGSLIYHEQMPLSQLQMSKRKTKETKGFQKELQTYEKKGISLWLNGNVSNPKEIVKAHMVTENGVYMRDYVQNEKGEIEKLKFDLIKTK